MNSTVIHKSNGIMIKQNRFASDAAGWQPESSIRNPISIPVIILVIRTRKENKKKTTVKVERRSNN